MDSNTLQRALLITLLLSTNPEDFKDSEFCTAALPYFLRPQHIGIRQSFVEGSLRLPLGERLFPISPR